MENIKKILSEEAEYDPIAVREIAYLEKSCFPEDHWSLEAVRSSLKRADIIYDLEYSEGKAIGYFLAAASFDQCELYRIAVLKEYRGQGRGKILMERFLQTLPEGTEKIYLEVRESNKTAISLYEKFGFKKLAERKNYYGDENGFIYVLTK